LTAEAEKVMGCPAHSGWFDELVIDTEGVTGVSRKIVMAFDATGPELLQPAPPSNKHATDCPF
jgi:hypothetical protein